MTDVQHALSAMNRQQVVYLATTMKQLIADSLAARRFSMILLAVFAALALLLATVGMYGVISYLVSQRTQEIGIRMALGASRIHILRLILREGLRMLLIGGALGLAASMVVAQTMQSLLFSVGPRDPASFALVALTLLLTTLVATLIPARGAMQLDPTTALRHE
jgi:ABC-type antimicrobial peptide transport system permease subunit